MYQSLTFPINWRIKKFIFLQKRILCQQETFPRHFGTVITSRQHRFQHITTRWVICTRRKAVCTRQSPGCILATILMPRMHITTTWLSTAVCFDYRSSMRMVIVQGKRGEATKRRKRRRKNSQVFKYLNSRLHHDQQTAHALESAAAAYSNYPMSGELTWRYLDNISICANRGPWIAEN